ncbi:MAG: hypothetical protein QM780_03000 [Hyphomicrobium sp.]|uniref:hypothetical protein n=1 Tax=Hyphomicrobium sp. TaxID=82 RepID=UPI0039E6E1D7
MFSTTVPKLAASAFVVLASASGVAGIAKTTSVSGDAQGISIGLDDNSLLVATLANGEVETHWMTRAGCERVASAVGAGQTVSGVRADGVRISITEANCSTRRVQIINPDRTLLSSAQARN